MPSSTVKRGPDHTCSVGLVLLSGTTCRQLCRDRCTDTHRAFSAPLLESRAPPLKEFWCLISLGFGDLGPPASHLILPVPLGCCCVSRCGLHYSCSLSMDSSSTAFPVPVFNRFLLYDRIWKLLSFVNYVTLSDLTRSPLLL